MWNLSDVEKLCNTVEVKPEEIISLVAELSARREAGKSVGPEAAPLLLFHRYGAEDGKLFAIMERMRCLAELVQQNDSRLRGWTLEGKEEGCLITNAAVFRATALCPVRVKDSRSYFNPDEFFDLVLGKPEPEGSQ